MTTGKGCTDVRGACSNYSGTISSCNGLFGIDGYCKGTNANFDSPCVVKVCTDATSTFSTDAACE